MSFGTTLMRWFGERLFDGEAGKLDRLRAKKFSIFTCNFRLYRVRYICNYWVAV
jgi:hypothetical protein